jgi:hypothetical protein
MMLGCRAPVSMKCMKRFRKTSNLLCRIMRGKVDSRRIHRLLVPVCAVPLILTSLSGSLYGALTDRGVEVTWLLKMHTGNFGLFNLQPYYSAILGVLTVVLALSGIVMFLGVRRGRLDPSVN